MIFRLFIIQQKNNLLLPISVAYPPFHFDQDPYPTFLSDLYPDTYFQFDPDPITHFLPDLDPAMLQKWPSKASTFSLRCGSGSATTASYRYTVFIFYITRNRTGFALKWRRQKLSRVPIIASIKAMSNFL